MEQMVTSRCLAEEELRLGLECTIRRQGRAGQREPAGTGRAWFRQAPPVLDLRGQSFAPRVARTLLGRKSRGIKPIVGDVVHAGMKYVSHILSGALDMLGVGARKEIIDRRLEQGDPSLELRQTHRGDRSEPHVGGKRITGVSATAKEHGFPKLIHLWQVSSPIDPRDIIENESEQVVPLYSFVESVH
jgi:hypothetical protein